MRAQRTAVAVATSILAIGTPSALAMATAGGSFSRQRTATRCPQAHAHPVLADSQAVIYTIAEARRGLYETEHFIATRVCAYGHKGSFKIGETRVPEPTEGWGADVFHITLDGTMLAYEKRSSTYSRYYREGEPASSTWQVIVRDARTGRVVRTVPTGTATPQHPWLTFIGDGETTAIVVKRDGSVAWVTDTVQSTNRYEVHTADQSSSNLLAIGSNIAPYSLALAGSTLYWTQGGKPFSASLN
jgi:hypothetical protein